MKPNELNQTLAWLPPNGRLYLPVDILEELFPHALNAGEVDARSFQAAQTLAEDQGCAFGYDDEVHMGIFRKLEAGAGPTGR